VNRGKYTIVAIFILAFALSAYAWWHAYHRGRRTKQLWGSRRVLLIERAPHVELLWLAADDAPDRSGPVGPDSPWLDLGDQQPRIRRRVDISRAPGLVHARHWLVEDAYFAWDQRQPPKSSHWRFALRFSDGQQTATLAFDVESRRVRMVENGSEAETGDIIEALAKFVEPFERPAPSQDVN
jgi:hypothetical protein